MYNLNFLLFKKEAVVDAQHSFALHLVVLKLKLYFLKH